MEDAPSYSAVRAMLRVLEEKGHVKHEAEGLKYVYVPVVGRDKAKRSAVKHVMETFFNGSAEQIVAALLDVSVKTVETHRAQLVERPHLELASPLACHSQLPPHLDQRLRWLPRETEPQLEYQPEAFVE